MDLSKAFDCVPHDLLIAKLEAYGFDLNALKFFYSYLKRRKQCVKINNWISSFQELISGVPQGSNLGPILFNIFINDLYFWIVNSDLANYADDNTISAFANSIKELITKLENDSEVAIQWFKDNGMSANPDKFQAMIINKCGRHKDLHSLKIGGFDLLGIEIDNKLNFNSQIGSLCKSVAGQLNTINAYNKYINFEAKKALLESFVQSNFDYCPLVWMLISPKSMIKIESIQERALRLLFDNYNNTYENLLERANKPNMVTRMHRSLAIEVYKTLNDYNPSYMKDVFMKNSRATTRRPNDIIVQGYKGITYGKNSLRVIAPTVWNKLPNDLRTAPSLQFFKGLIKTWKDFEHCKCKMCNVMSKTEELEDP